MGLDTPRLAGSDAGSAVGTLVFAATAGDVKRVVAGGREIVRDGRHTDVDVPAELEAAIRGVWA